MSEHNPEIHHRRSIRIKGFDYSSPGAYFVTITTYERRFVFGEILNGSMSLNRYGLAAQECWKQLPEHFDNIEADEYVVMPNHIHGIVIINAAGGHSASNMRERDGNVGARHAAPLQNFAMPTPGSLSAIVLSFKSAATRRINLLRGTPAAPVWQRNYYERVVRSDVELYETKEYIRNNPAKWAEDRENPSKM